ncbi:MAG: D-glycerate dehydrogenase, partial [Phycisphaerae bacterium]|nr:D-glycerate dehydrogenase [Phycisphaerae bacterium]
MLPVLAMTRAVPVRGGADGVVPRVGWARVSMAPAVPQMGREALLEFVRTGGGLGPPTVVATMFHDRVDEEFLRAAGGQLRGVCNFAVGVDNIDLGACRARGVAVTNTPDAVTEGTANLAIGLMLAVSRRIVEGDAFVRSGRFEKEGNTFPTGWLGMHLSGQVMLIVGAGRIGRAVALRAQAFGMRVLYVARGRHVDFEGGPLGARKVELDEGLALADVVSLHTPLTTETRHLIDGRRLGLMKPTAILVNTARGPVVDEAALAAALSAGRIWGAGLDVFEREPAVDAGLVGLKNVVMTPHVGSGERYWREEMTRMVLENAEAIIAGREPANRVS